MSTNRELLYIMEQTDKIIKIMETAKDEEDITMADFNLHSGIDEILLGVYKKGKEGGEKK